MKIKYLIFVVLLVGLILVSGCVQNENIKNKEDSTKSLQEKFQCENDNTNVQSRGYVLLMGLADHNKESWDVEKSLMEKDPKTKFVLIYDQDENSHIEEISKKFLFDMEDLLKKNPVDELVIFGASAGGVTSSYSISKLNFSGSIALHTMSSPLKGYGFKGIAEAFLGKRSVFEKDVALGLEPFQTPRKNVKVYHHKTVTDTILKGGACREFAALCDPIKIQNNNIEGSKEFYYPQYDHNPLMKFVIREVLKCYNPAINEVIEKENIEAEQGLGFGSLCSGEESCRILCHNNMGKCRQFCDSNSENLLCKKLFTQRSEQQTKQTEPEQKSPETKADEKPVLKNFGLKIETWDKKKNKAGDFLFENKNYVDDKIFTEFGHKIVNDMGEKFLPEIGFNVPVGTKVVSPIDGIVTGIKFYEPSKDYLISIKTDESSPWIVGFEHIYKVTVKEGDKVSAGQQLAEVSPSYGRTEFGNVEINVWTVGQNIIKYCPFDFLDESLKPIYEEKLKRLASDWEEFLEKNVYKQEDWIVPGCLVESIKEK